MIPDIKAVADYDNMITSLVQDELSTSYEMQDMTKMAYERDSELGHVTFDGGQRRLVLTEWSARQLCKLAGIPYGVWTKASAPLASDMLREFLPMIKEPQRKLVLKSRGSKLSLRSVLPIDYPDIRNSEVLKAVGDAAKGKLIVESANWMDSSDEPLFRTRFVLPDFKFELLNPKEDMYLGLDCLSSEAGAGPLTINLLLYRLVCKNGAIVVFEKKSYFSFNYSQALVVDIKDVLDSAVTRLGNDLSAIKAKVEEAVTKKIVLDQAKILVTNMAKEGQINKGVSVKTITEMEKGGVATVWDVANAMTAVARGYRDSLRLRYEIAGGALLGLEFQRRGQEAQYAERVDQYPLPGDTPSTALAAYVTP